MRATDIMRKSVVTVPQEMDVWELARLFAVKTISGAPVIDKEGNLVGVVSQTDIVRHLGAIAQSSQGADDFYKEAEYDVSNLILKTVTAGDLMSAGPVCASEDASVNELSQIMLSHGIHRVIIVRDRKIVGIVTSMDLLKVL